MDDKTENFCLIFIKSMLLKLSWHIYLNFKSSSNILSIANDFHIYILVGLKTSKIYKITSIY